MVADMGMFLVAPLPVPSINSVRHRKPTDSECLRIALANAYDSLSAAFRRPPKPSRRPRRSSDLRQSGCENLKIKAVAGSRFEAATDRRAVP